MTATRHTSLLSLPADPTSLAEGRAALRAALRVEGVDGEAAERIVLATSEALANALEHGSRAGARILVELGFSPGEVEVSVLDAGRPGSAAPLARRPSPPPSSTRGRGLMIMRALADAMEVRPVGGGTRVQLGFARELPSRLAA
jgi:anti-sigma regulatory factor (Ser/Thr protein kinase)